MNFNELIKLRQSDRSYLPQPVEEKKVMQCIETARLAPSACNAQPWKFVVVDDPGLKNTLADCAASMGMNKFVVEAPLVLALVLEKPNLTSKIGSVLKGKEYTLIDIGVVANQFCLQATELGLGTCMIGWFDEKRVRKTLNVPFPKRIPLLITLGYPNSPNREKKRKPLEQIFSKNRY